MNGLFEILCKINGSFVNNVRGCGMLLLLFRACTHILILNTKNGCETTRTAQHSHNHRIRWRPTTVASNIKLVLIFYRNL
jgi:hypothetical protein